MKISEKVIRLLGVSIVLALLAVPLYNNYANKNRENKLSLSKEAYVSSINKVASDNNINILDISLQPLNVNDVSYSVSILVSEPEKILNSKLYDFCEEIDGLSGEEGIFIPKLTSIKGFPIVNSEMKWALGLLVENGNTLSKNDSVDTSEKFKSMVENQVATSFSNKFGTASTTCAHVGCNNYIALSGDTNCCTIHSKKCLECGDYIDEDAAYCMSCLENVYTPPMKKTTLSSTSKESYWCMGKNDTCQNKTYDPFDFYCSVCDKNNDNIEDR